MADLAEQVAGLRALADFLEAHPKFHSSWECFTYTIIADTAGEFAALCREIGSGEKGKTSANHLSLTRDFGGDVKVSIWVPKEQTCERRVVGQETVTKMVPPPDVQLVKVTETVDVVEWVCPPSFLGLADEPDDEPLPGFGGEMGVLSVADTLTRGETS